MSIKPSMTISASAGTSRSTVLALHNVDRLAGKTASDTEFVQVNRQFLRRHKCDVRRSAENDGTRHPLVATLLVLLVMPIAAGAANARRHAHDQAVGRFQSGAISAHVLDAGFGILVMTFVAVSVGRRRNPASKPGSAAHRGHCPRLQRIARDHHLLAERLVHQTRRDRIGDRTIPVGLHVFSGAPMPTP